MKHYVYRHIRLDTGKPFYIGKGMGRRAFRLSIRNPYHKNITKKVDIRIEIVKYFSTHEEALQFESTLIKAYLKTGIKLVNMSLGGEGTICKRGPVSIKTKQKISKKLKGRKLPKSTRIKMSQTRGGKNNPNFKGTYKTPYGNFYSAQEAANSIGIKAMTINQRCKYSKSDKFRDWSFEKC